MFLLGEFDILDQIGDAYIRAIYCYGNPASIDNVFTDGDNGDANNASDPVGYGKRYQLPRGVKPNAGSKRWGYIQYIRDNLEGYPKEYIDNLHFEKGETGKIHWDPNNPQEGDFYNPDHVKNDWRRKETPKPKFPYNLFD